MLPRIPERGHIRSVLHLVSGDESEQKTTLATAENPLEDDSGSIDDAVVVAQADSIGALTSEDEFETT